MADNMADEEAFADVDVQDTDVTFRRVQQTHEVAGYREGLEAGKEAHLQQGFDQGFAIGACVAMEWGKLRGSLCALMSMAHSKTVEHSHAGLLHVHIAELAELIQEVHIKEKESLDVQQTFMTHFENNSRGDQHYSKFDAETFAENKEIAANQSTDGCGGLKQEFTQNGMDISVSFERLCADDRNASSDLRCLEKTEKIVEFPDKLCNKNACVCSEDGTAVKDVLASSSDELENMWTKCTTLAEKIGVHKYIVARVRDV